MPRKVLVSRHAQEQMARRQIPREWLESVIENPQQRAAQPGSEENGQGQGAAGSRDGLPDEQD
ncbi:MAG: DUF4258 domain-containing protein [Bryobacteraceae bacterium]|jgi:hypothetical protein